jgi:hypothetical protein
MVIVCCYEVHVVLWEWCLVSLAMEFAYAGIYRDKRYRVIITAMVHYNVQKPEAIYVLINISDLDTW